MFQILLPQLRCLAALKMGPDNVKACFNRFRTMTDALIDVSIGKSSRIGIALATGVDGVPLILLRFQSLFCSYCTFIGRPQQKLNVTHCWE